MIAPSGHLVVYMGDDERGEYMYKYVSNNTYAPGGDTDDLMENGRLCTAKFNWDGTGEWVELTPESTGMTVEEICVLTRVAATNAAGQEMTLNAPNPRSENGYGQIVRWYPSNDDHATDMFRWDLYCMAGNPKVHDDAYAGSPNIDEGNMFNSPDGMMFDSAGYPLDSD